MLCIAYPQVTKYPHRVERWRVRRRVEVVTLYRDLTVPSHADVDIGDITGIDGAVTDELNRPFFYPFAAWSSRVKATYELEKEVLMLAILPISE